MEVRLAGLVTPQNAQIESGQEQNCGQRAREYLTELIMNKVVEVKAYGGDKQYRILAEVYLGDQNVNLEMVRAGMAAVDNGAPPAGLDLKPYREAEEEARKMQRGVWALGEK